MEILFEILLYMLLIFIGIAGAAALGALIRGAILKARDAKFPVVLHLCGGNYLLRCGDWARALYCEGEDSNNRWVLQRRNSLDVSRCFRRSDCGRSKSDKEDRFPKLSDYDVVCPMPDDWGSNSKIPDDLVPRLAKAIVSQSFKPQSKVEVDVWIETQYYLLAS